MQTRSRMRMMMNRHGAAGMHRGKRGKSERVAVQWRRQDSRSPIEWQTSDKVRHRLNSMTEARLPPAADDVVPVSIMKCVVRDDEVTQDCVARSPCDSRLLLGSLGSASATADQMLVAWRSGREWHAFSWRMRESRREKKVCLEGGERDALSSPLDLTPASNSPHASTST